MTAETAKCATCGREFEEKHYQYEIKLDDGSIVVTHGYPCTEEFAQKVQRKITGGDWWIRRRPKK